MFQIYTYSSVITGNKKQLKKFYSYISHCHCSHIVVVCGRMAVTIGIHSHVSLSSMCMFSLFILHIHSLFILSPLHTLLGFPRLHLLFALLSTLFGELDLGFSKTAYFLYPVSSSQGESWPTWSVSQWPRPKRWLWKATDKPYCWGHLWQCPIMSYNSVIFWFRCISPFNLDNSLCKKM